MTQNLLKLNYNKANIIYLASPHCIKSLKTPALQMGASWITPNGSVKNIEVITNTRKYDHITPILQKLHWLPVRWRIHIKILLITYKSINDMAPEYTII